MRRPECAVDGCKNAAWVGYGQSWVCGNCMVEIKEMESKKTKAVLDELSRRKKDAN